MPGMTEVGLTDTARRAAIAAVVLTGIATVVLAKFTRG